jgi:hypothetical protein
VDIGFKAVLALALLWLFVYRPLIAGRNFLNRRKFEVNPLTVSGSGFDGRQFVDIVTDMYYRANRFDIEQDRIARALIRGTAAPNAAVVVPRMRFNNASGVVETMGGAAEAVPGDASKLAAIVLKLLQQPCYTCSGSINIAASGTTYILVRVERRGEVIARWESTGDRATTTLIDDLKDCAFEILQMTAQNMDAHARDIDARAAKWRAILRALWNLLR